MERAPGGPLVKFARPQQVVKAGTMIADKYRVEKELGRGGFGVVVRARHLAIDQIVAIKILTPGDGGEAEWREDAARFKREAQATAALRSEHVVRILDVDLLESGAPYIVMEYLEGETLHHALHTRVLSVGEAVDHVLEVLAALAEAHAAGIVHRDLKPANVLITKGAGGTLVAKVVDFGVSKFGALGASLSASNAGAHGAHPITKTGAVIGTIAYMAPEQMVDAKRVDARADLWSVGIMLYELLTRLTPFGSPNHPTIVSSMLTKPPASLMALRSDVPPQLEKVVMGCLEKLPEKRYPTAAAVGAALADFGTPRSRSAIASLRLAGNPSGAAAPVASGQATVENVDRRDASNVTPSRRTSEILKVVKLMGLMAVVATIGLVVGLLVARRGEPENPNLTHEAGVPGE